MSNVRETANEYEPRKQPESFTDREKQLMKRAYLAGRQYEASLFADVLNNIVESVRRYRTAAKGDNDA